MSLPDYAELWCLSNFSFLRGASHPKELVERAAQLGYRALALTDECSLAGIVRAHVAAKQHGLKLLVGAQFRVQPDGGLEHGAQARLATIANSARSTANPRRRRPRTSLSTSGMPNRAHSASRA